MTAPGDGIGKKTIRDIDVANKKVLVRCDLNVPLANGHITDDTRIRESLPTLRYLLERHAHVIVCSHLGRPKGADPALSLAPIAGRLGNMLDREVLLARDCVGPAAEQAVASMGNHVLLLENVRFHPEEEANDPAFARQLASLADIYVNDAFGAAHRAHASTEGVAHLLPAVAGFLMEKEVRYLGSLVADPPRPFAAVIGGAKVSTKLATIQHLLPRIDLLVLGGGMANTFLAATGVDVGMSVVEKDLFTAARELLDSARSRDVAVELPVDVVAADKLADDADHRTVPAGAVPRGYLVLDIGPQTVDRFSRALKAMKAVVWNGPMGVFELEPFASGSQGIARAIAKLDATTVVGGGETAALVHEMGLEKHFTHVSTGGGASLEMLEGRALPGVAALLDS